MILDVVVLYLFTGLAAGFVGGLLGLGGGIVLVPVLRFGLDFDPAMAAGTTVVAVFFTTLGGTLRHQRHRTIPWRSLVPVMLAGALAALLFSLFFTTLARRPGWLDLGMGVVFSLVATRMIGESLFEAGRAVGEEETPRAGERSVQKVSIGVAAGALPGLLGIGAGSVLVPAFRLLLRWPIKVAMGSSLACFSVNALISSTLKWGQGYVDPGVALPAALGAFLGATVGAAVNRRFPSRALELLFGAVFLYVASKFILAYFGVRI